MEYFFNKYSEFISNDVRRNRNVSPVVAESFSNRHEATLPKHIVDGKTILDLGSCLGATGHWCLHHGAKHYTGIEAQQTAVDKSRELLGNYWGEGFQFETVCNDIELYLDSCIAVGKTFDVVVAFGIVYGYVNYYSLLSKITKVTNDYILIDCRYPNLMNIQDPVVQFTSNQHFHIDGEASLNYVGTGAKLGPAALRIVMQTLGWNNNDELIFPVPVEDDMSIDLYHTEHKRTYGLNLPTRYLTRFEKSIKTLASVSENVANANGNFIAHDNRKQEPVTNAKWEFDKGVANRFQKEAETHIPDYHSVIELSCDIIEDAFPDKKNTTIIDVGSALGFTVEHFVNKGYKSTFGVEKSHSMIERTKLTRHIFHSDTLPENMRWDAVIANWTLHFIDEREEYIQDIANALNPGGILILTDKMDSTPTMEELYYNFKRRNGISDEEIYAKRDALKHILTTKSLYWYVDILRKMGFEEIEVVNSRFMFETIYAKKPI